MTLVRAYGSHALKLDESRSNTFMLFQRNRIMDKDRHAVKLSLEHEARDAILGVFGDSDFDQMLGRMFTVLDMADNLLIHDMKIEVTLKQLKKARAEYMKSVDLTDE